VERAELAALVAAADEAERAKLLTSYASLADVSLAQALKKLYDDTRSSDPAYAAGVAVALTELAGWVKDPEVNALAAWTAGMAALHLDGQMELALVRLDQAAAEFAALGQGLVVADIQVNRLHALAMLGRYDEALECGLQARDVFLAHGDTLAAGRIEQNLGNIYFRRDAYREAEQLYRTARERYMAAGEQKHLAQIDNCLASALTWQHQFRAAAQLYEQALAHAEAAGMEVTQAEIESNLGGQAMFQGRYDQALDYLERSRRRYTALGMPHEAATIEKELADAYLELNLVPEAAAIYARVSPLFAELGMQAEQAWALTHYSRACLLLGQPDEAYVLLAEARTLHVSEGNAIGEAMVTLIEAQLYYIEGDYESAALTAAQTEAPFAAASTWEWLLLARWLRAEALRVLGYVAEARTLLAAVLREANQWALPQIALRCHTSLGLLAAALGDGSEAEAAFKQAITLVEALRAPLPAEEFYTAFIADKLTPYTELARLCLTDGDANRVVEALDYVERARSRALADILRGVLPFRPKPRDAFEAELFARLEELRHELNWFYSQLNHLPQEDTTPSVVTMTALQDAARERETAILEVTRQLQQRGQNNLIQVEPLQTEQLQQALGPETALVEYFSLDGQLLAFVVTSEQVEVVGQLGDEEWVEAELKQLRFQLDVLRYGAERLHAHLGQLTQRVRHYLSKLYDVLLRPLEDKLGDRRLVIAPFRALHYVPFHALYDGVSYVIEHREVCYTPSASVLQDCLARPPRLPQRAILLGVPDPQAPRVRDEVAGLVALFPEAVTLLDDQATLAALREQAPTADVLHLACHGQFRPDNPLFSSLRLADGWLTVRDAYNLDLPGGLVTLSACETGMSAVAPGDELIGLARGFLSAGAPSLLVSLWTVDDESTATLMTSFYSRLRSGDGPAAALRQAQRQALESYPHPFFWSPFVLFGRW
jgi:CHAT domain-containing protein/tetratricopeptide (TPR) repeat protein